MVNCMLCDLHLNFFKKAIEILYLNFVSLFEIVIVKYHKNSQDNSVSSVFLLHALYAENCVTLKKPETFDVIA